MNQFSIRSIRRELDLTLDRLAEILRVSARMALGSLRSVVEMREKA